MTTRKTIAQSVLETVLKRGLRESVWVLLILAILLSACSHDDSVTPDQKDESQDTALGTNPLGFSAYFADSDDNGTTKATRAAGDGELTDELLKEKGFGVYCWYTGSANFTTPKPTSARDVAPYAGQPYVLLMRNQKVEWRTWDGISESWGYTPKKYWPMDPNEKLTLRAYAPYTDYLVTDDNGMPQLPVVVTADDFHNGTQHDPLWGTSKHDGTVDGDDAVTNNEVYGKLYNNYVYRNSGSLLATDNRDGTIDWYFHHGMSSLMFTLSITPDPGCDKVTITGIKVTPLYTQGLLDLSSATTSSSDKPTWTERDGTMTVELKEGEPNTTAGDLAPIPTPDPEPLDFNPYPFSITPNPDPLQSTEAIPLLSHGLLIIPRDLTSEGMTVTVTYYTDGESSDPLEAVATIKRNFEGNTSYILGLSLTPETKGLEIDVVQSAFTTWVDAGTITHSVYNW